MLFTLCKVSHVGNSPGQITLELSEADLLWSEYLQDLYSSPPIGRVLRCIGTGS